MHTIHLAYTMPGMLLIAREGTVGRRSSITQNEKWWFLQLCRLMQRR